MQDLAKDEYLEQLIHNAQKWQCAITSTQLGEYSNIQGTFEEMFSDAAKAKLLAYELIHWEAINSSYVLTQKGMLFESFEKENEVYRKERFVKHNAYWKAKNWVWIAVVGWIFGLISGLLLYSLTSRQVQPTEKTTKDSVLSTPN